MNMDYIHDGFIGALYASSFFFPHVCLSHTLKEKFKEIGFICILVRSSMVNQNKVRSSIWQYHYIISYVVLVSHTMSTYKIVIHSVDLIKSPRSKYKVCISTDQPNLYKNLPDLYDWSKLMATIILLLKFWFIASVNKLIMLWRNMQNLLFYLLICMDFNNVNQYKLIGQEK